MSLGTESEGKCVICRNDVDGAMLFPNDGRNIYYHFQCVILPRLVKHDRHCHELCLRLPLDENDEFSEFICDVCEEERDPDDCVYYCEPCEVVAHIGCGISGLDRPIQDVLGKKLQEPDYQESTKYQFGSKEEAEKVEESDLHCVDHELYCSKEHPLVLVKYTRTIKEICDGCAFYVSGMTYSCKECNIYIHKRCTEIPKEIHHSMHSDHGPLILLLPDIAFCDHCHRFFYSSAPIFQFGCIECDFHLDTGCAFLPNNLNHSSHGHDLSPVIVWHSYGEDEDGPSNDLKLPIRTGITPSCRACGFLCDHLSLECEKCNFYIHIFCSLLTLMGKHPKNRHNLNLNYSYEEDPNALEFICGTCEKPRIPNCWVYYCLDPKCDIVSHLECVGPDIYTISEN